MMPAMVSEGSTRPTAIDIRSLRVDYGDFVAVHDLNLKVPRGEVFGIVGPNGAGKTSTFKVVTTLMQPTYGSVILDGHDISEDLEQARRIISLNSKRMVKLCKKHGICSGPKGKFATQLQEEKASLTRIVYAKHTALGILEKAGYSSRYKKRVEVQIDKDLAKGLGRPTFQKVVDFDNMPAEACKDVEKEHKTMMNTLSNGPKRTAVIIL